MKSPHLIAAVVTMVILVIFLALKPVLGFIFGLRTYWPSIYPTLTPAIGPRKGMSEMPRAQEAPAMASMSGSFFLSAERTVAMTWVSF